MSNHSFLRMAGWLGGQGFKFNRSMFRDVSQPCSRTGLTHVTLNKTNPTAFLKLDIRSHCSRCYLQCIGIIYSIYNIYTQVPDHDHLPDLRLHHQGADRVQQQVQGVLQRQRGHRPHDVRHQIRTLEVGLDIYLLFGSIPIIICRGA